MPYNLTEQPEINDEIEVPEGSDIVSRPALISVFQRLANRTRNLMERLGGRTGDSEWLYLDEAGDPAPKSRDVRLHPLDAVTIDGSVSYTSWLDVKIDDGRIYVPLRLPRGSVLRQVRVEGVRTPGIGITVTASIRNGVSVLWGTVTDSDPGDDFVIQNTGLSETIDPTGAYILVIQTSGVATVTLMRVTVDDPGPRNF